MFPFISAPQGNSSARRFTYYPIVYCPRVLLRLLSSVGIPVPLLPYAGRLLILRWKQKKEETFFSYLYFLFAYFARFFIYLKLRNETRGTCVYVCGDILDSTEESFTLAGKSYPNLACVWWGILWSNFWYFISQWKKLLWIKF